MADISFFEGESDVNINDEHEVEDGLDEENLTLLQQLAKYMDSDIILNRQTVAQSLVETLQAAGENEDACLEVLNNMAHLSQDPEASVRCDLMEQITHIAVYCHEKGKLLNDVMHTYIVPMVLRYLSDINTQVRKMSQIVLLEMLKKQLIEKEDIEQQVIGAVLELASPDSHDDYRTEAVALMSRMAPLLGQEITELHFLPRFCQLLTDPLFHVRKVCASYFGEVCNVVGKESSEQVLLPKLNSLCGDGVWGVRKACAECFTTISSTCSPSTRRSYLANLFVDLLTDQSRWVRMSAFQHLGPFISTFADSHETTEDDSDVTHEFETTEDDSDVTRKLETTEDDSDVTHEEPLLVVEVGEGSSTLAPSVGNGNEVISCDCGQNEKIYTAQLDQEVEGGDNMLQDNSRLLSLDVNVEDSKPSEEQLCSIGSSSNSIESRIPSLSLEVVEEKESLLENDVPSETDDMVCSERENGDTATASSNNSANCDTYTNTDHLYSAVADTQDFANPTAEMESNSLAFDHSVDRNICDTTTALLNANSDHQVSVALDSNFNTFQYWRLPIPTVDIDMDIIGAVPDSIHVVAMTEEEEQDAVSSPASGIVSADEDSMECLSADAPFITDFSNLDIRAASAEEVGEVIGNFVSFNMMNDSLENLDLEEEEEVDKGREVDKDRMDDSLTFIDADLIMPHQQDDMILARQQDIIPQSLLENYLGMVEPSRAQTVDPEIAQLCAYNLPAVAYTLGPQNWHCIRSLYKTLSQTTQWKVRQTLALSIHEMAAIEGEEITHRDLVPIFEAFMQDVDEVRDSLLKHLAIFFRMLQPDTRKHHLPTLQVYLHSENPRNWRVRLDLAEQLVLLCDLYDAVTIYQCIAPMVLKLIHDKVAVVRSAAIKLVVTVMRRLYEDGQDDLLHALYANMINGFAINFTWLQRQMYCQICKLILEEKSLPYSTFSTLFLPGVLNLGTDRVPNVRRYVALVLKQCFVLEDKFMLDVNPHSEQMRNVMQGLQSDEDRDVRLCFHLEEPSISDANTKLTHDKDVVPVLNEQEVE